jgi:hypothetical protein
MKIAYFEGRIDAEEIIKKLTTSGCNASFLTCGSLCKKYRDAYIPWYEFLIQGKISEEAKEIIEENGGQLR